MMNSKLILWRFLLVAALAALQGCSVLFPVRTVKVIKYPVGRGEDILLIAERFDIPPSRIREFNKLRPEPKLLAGQVLHIPLDEIGGMAQGARASLKLPATDKASDKTVKLSRAKRHVGKLMWPVSMGRLTSPFGTRWLSFHEGVDIAHTEGTPILAAHDGQVVYSGDGLRGYGNLIVLKGADMLTVYGHNKRNTAKLGSNVRKGAQIAELGQSGKANAPHLHFEVRIKDASQKNVAVDPLAFFP